MSARELLLIWTASSSLACAAGSGSWQPAHIVGEETTQGLASVAVPLAAGVDPEVEIRGPLTSPPGSGAEEFRPVRDSSFGARCGALMMGEAGWETGWRAGAYYRARLPNGMPLELGLDFGSAKKEDGAVVSSLVYLRADVAFTRRRHGPGPALYPSAGFEIAYERADYPLTGEEAEGLVPGLNLALGLGAPSGRWDARLQYSLLMGSSDVATEWVLAVSFGF